LKIDPYVGAQVSWTPDVAPVTVIPPDLDVPGRTVVSAVQLWFDLGLRNVFLL